MAATLLAAWMGVRLGRFSRNRETAAFIHGPRAKNRLLAALAITPVLCLGAALIPPALIEGMVNNWMSLPLPRPHEANATWGPDMNMLFAKGDAIILRREEAPAIVWIF